MMAAAVVVVQIEHSGVAIIACVQSDSLSRQTWTCSHVSAPKVREQRGQGAQLARKSGGRTVPAACRADEPRDAAAEQDGEPQARTSSL